MPANVGIDQVEINGRTYRLALDAAGLPSPLIEGVVEEFPENIRDSGVQLLKDRRGKSAWLIQELLGVGQFYLNDLRKSPHAQSSLAETRWGEITHRPLVQDSVGQTVATTPSIQLVQFASDLGWVRTDAAATTKARAGTWTADTWANGTVVAMDTDPSAPTLTVQTNSNYMLASHVLKDSLVVYFFDHSTNGDARSLNVTTMTAWGAGTWVGRIFSFTTGADDVVRAITWNTTTSVFGVFDASAKTLTIYKNTNNWASTATTTLATISAGAFTGMTIYRDLSGNLRVMVATDDAVWAIDVSTANNETKVMDLPTDVNNGRGMTVWAGRLIVPLGSGGVEVREWNGATMLSYPLEHRHGPDEPVSHNRLPSGWEGWVTASVPTNDWLLLAYGGNATGDTAHIFAVDHDFNWHVIYEHDTTNEEITHMIISSEQDAQSRLHIIAAHGADFFHLDDPLENPRRKSIPSAASNVVTLPEWTGGMPHIDKCFLQVVVDAESLSASTAGEYINVDYGIDDNVIDTDLGNFLSGDKDLVFGASSQGVSGKTLTIQLDQKRDATVNTDRSYIRSLIVEFLALPDRLETYEMVIDCQATAEASGGQLQVKDVIDNLNTIQGSKTMVTLSFEGRAQVRVIALPTTITQHALSERFDVATYNPATVRYLKLTELL